MGEQLSLQIVDVTQKFGGLTALNQIRMDVRRGEIIGIIGPNGAGKTTLFNIITGVYRPSSGRILLEGEDITGLKPHQITRRGFARTFQNIRLFPRMNVFENVQMGMCCHAKANLLDALLSTPAKRRELREQQLRVNEILERMGLSGKKYAMPGSLPYGEQRKLEIARALATQPKILLLDEPAAGMNEQETADLLVTVQKLRELGITILLIEHDMKFVMNICERIYVLNYGELIASGTPEEIQHDEMVIEAYLGKDVDDE